MKLIRSLIPALIFIEVLLFFGVYFVVGYLFRKEDPLFLQTAFSPASLLATVISLYYGLPGGVLFGLFLLTSSYFLYKPYPMYHVLWNFLFILIASEFKYYWTRRIKKAEVEVEYTKEQITKLRRELFLLQLSHEQLEFNYVVRPYSLRRIILELKEKLLREEQDKEIFQFVMSIFFQQFKVYKAVLYLYKNGDFVPVASVGQDIEKLDKSDPLVKEAIEAENSFYLPPKALKHYMSNGRLRYLAVVYASSENLKALLVIKDILFVNLNEEVLNYITIILQYILEDIVISKELRKFYKERKPICQFDFHKEFYKMYRLKKKMGIISSIVIFNYESIGGETPYEIEHQVRALDMFCHVKDKKVIIFLLPFTSHAGAIAFSKRISEKFNELRLLKILEVDKPTPEDTIKEVLK